MDNQGRQEMEINERIKKANSVYYTMRQTFINKREISQKIKMFVLTYGCEVWVLKQHKRNKLQAAEMKYLRRVKDVIRMDKIRSEVIRKELKIESITQFTERKQLSWLGHLHRMDNNMQVKRVWQAKTLKKRRRGRLKETWDNVVGQLLRNKGKTWQKVRGIVRNKNN